MPVQVGEPLSLEDVVAVARGERVELPTAVGERISAARAVIENAVTSNATVYGVTTGFGSLANVRIDPERADALQEGIVRSHATAVGRPLSREEARAMLLLRAHVLALGHSGVRVEIVERMVEMLNRDLIPVVPEQGSLGASGDLAPLANLSLPLLGAGDVLSGGNFHGQPVAVALDALAAAIVPMASIAERRLYRLLDPVRNNGLPAFLVAESGLNSGFMLAQYTAASLVSECKTLAHPASVDSIGSSAGQEDHVSMGMTSARHARDVVANAEIVVAIEAMIAAQALDLRAPLEPASGTAAARDAIREVVPILETDRELGPDIEAVTGLVRSGAFVEAAGSAVGPLD